jgi:hypothetical protein
MANACKNKITVIGLKEEAEIFVKPLSKAMFDIDLDNINPKQWGEDNTVDGKTWYSTLVKEYHQRRWAARYGILYPHEPYERLGITVPRFYVETKWTPPANEIIEASKVFPDLTFHLDWWVQQDGPSGEVVIRNGNDIDEMIRPASRYLFDTILYPRISLLTAHLPYTLAQRATLRVQDAIQAITDLRQILNDRRFTESSYAIERNPAALKETKSTMEDLLGYMRKSAERVSFDGVFLGVHPFLHEDDVPALSTQENNLDIAEV